MQKVCVNLPSQPTFNKIWTNDVIADNATPTINWPWMLKWYSSHSSRILIFPIMHIMPIHISRICEVSFIRKSTLLKNEKSVRILLRIQLQKLTRFMKSLPYKSWCKDIRYGWNLCWSKILNTDSWLIPLFFSICLLLACGFSVAKGKIAATLFSLTIGRRLTRVCFTVPKRQKRSAYRFKAMCDFCCLSEEREPHTKLGRFRNVYGIPPAPSTYQNILKNCAFSRSDVLTLEGKAWLTDMST